MLDLAETDRQDSAMGGADRAVSRRALILIAFGLACVSGVAFTALGIHELQYASDHPGHYGPAKVIAWIAFSGAGACAAQALLILALSNRFEVEG
jgi:hypothetical protein